MNAYEWLQSLVDHEVSSVGISAGNIEGLSLDGPRAVLEALGSPEQGIRIIHVTGTNGKGTVARMCESLILELGLRVGTTMSPEPTIAARIRVDGAPAKERDIDEAVLSVRAAAEVTGTRLSAFEATVLTALVCFADAPVDVAVVEVGMLGRFDATNIVDADVAVITNVEGDHTDYRPGWRAGIAAEKAGIIKPDSIAVIGEVVEEVRAVIASEPAEHKLWLGKDFTVDSVAAVGGRFVEIRTASGSTFQCQIPMFGLHVGDAAALAVQSVESLIGHDLDADVITQALNRVTVPNRIEVVHRSPLVILDGAHNLAAAAALGRTVQESFIIVGSRILVLGSMRGRDPRGFVAAMMEHCDLDVVICVPVDPPRGMEASELGELVSGLGPAVLVAPSVQEGVDRAWHRAGEEDAVIVTGSFKVLDAARAAIDSAARSASP